jgi:energy-coupling factor transporter ATP-binding protein EcfA2
MRNIQLGCLPIDKLRARRRRKGKEMIKRITTTYKNLNLDIKDLGEINYFVGKNGSGKTRLFDAVNTKFSKNEEIGNETKLYSFNVNLLEHCFNFRLNNQTEIDSLMAKDVKSYNITDEKNPYNKRRMPNGLTEDFKKHYITKVIIELFFGQNNFKIDIGNLRQGEFHSNNYIIFFEKEEYKFCLEECSSGFQSLFKTWNNIYHQNYPNSEGVKVDFTNKSVYYLLTLDEGDRHLHPFLAKLLPEKLELIKDGIRDYFIQNGSESKKTIVQIFVSTHSPFLIRGALKQDNHKIFLLENGKLKNSFDKQQLIEQSGLPFDNVLSDLGFEMKDIYYPNCLIYVEGPTDIIYIHYWLKLYIKENDLTDFQKGIDFDFVEYGGTLASHLTVTIQNPDDQFDTNLTTSLQNMFSSNRNVLFITDDDDGKSKFEDAKNRIEEILAENKKKGFNNEFIKCSSVKTIEDFIGDNINADKSKPKLKASINNVLCWKDNQDLKLSDFHLKLEQELICKVYDFIKICQNS